MFQQLDPIKATFQLSRILSDATREGERAQQLSHALEHIALCLAADRTYLSLWCEDQNNIRTIAQWQIEQLDPMPTAPIRMQDFSMLDEYFGQNRGMFSLLKEPIFSQHRLLAVLCAESRDPIESLSEDELKFAKNAAYMLASVVKNCDLPAALDDMDLLDANNTPDGKTDGDAQGDADQRSAPQVLIVEDNKINQLTIRKMLQRCGIGVETADDGLLGITASNKQKFDLILMDLSMPNMDGFDCTREILTACPLNKTTPIVAVSANTGEDVVSRCLKVGMSEYVAKPLHIGRVKELVEKYLKK